MHEKIDWSESEALICMALFILFGLLFLWPFLTSNTERKEWEFRETPLGLAVLRKDWDNLLLWPSIGFPAFVSPGSAFQVWVLCRERPLSWRIYVDNTLLSITDIKENAGIWTIELYLPENLEGVHDLNVEVDNTRIGDKKGKNSVVVLHHLPQKPRIVAISDTHIDEENWKVSTLPINPKPLFASKDLRGLPIPIKELFESIDEGMKRIKNGIMTCRPQHAQKLLDTLTYIKENLKPDLVLLTGDLVDWSSEISWNRLWELLACSKLPVCLVPGNHDHRGRIHIVQGRKWLAPFYRDFNSFDVYGFQLGEYYFVGVNSGHDWKPLDASKGSGLEKRHLSWLMTILNNKENIVFFLHHPSKENSMGLAHGWEHVLSRFGDKVSLVVCGHLHPTSPMENVVLNVKQIVVPSVQDSSAPDRAAIVLPMNQ
jgi:metallophosphoesterase superfamily enzyme